MKAFLKGQRKPLGPIGIRVFLFTLLSTVPCIAAAQTTTHGIDPAKNKDGTYTVRVNAKLVVLDVVVTDSRGEVVSNLVPEDFLVTEGGEAQTIKSFEAPSMHSLPPGVAISSTAELDRFAPNAAVNIILLDEINTRFEDMAFARYSLTKYLGQSPGGLAQPTMLVAVSLQRFTVLSDYTQDKAAILSSMDHHIARYPWHLDSGWQAEQFSAAFVSLMQIAQATMGHPGHKSMIWIGRGFPTMRFDQMTAAATAKLTDAIQACVNVMRDARITLYTVDPAGLAVDVPVDQDDLEVDDPFGGSVQFNAMAAMTGGKSFYGRNDVDTEIGTSVRDGSTFYAISYVPSSTSDSAKPFRGIRVIMKNPNFRATTREGYYVADATRPGPAAKSPLIKDRSKFDLLAAANTNLVYDGVPLTVTQAADHPGNITVHVDHTAIKWKDNGPSIEQTASLQILFAVFDRKNKMLSRVAKDVVTRSPAASSGSGLSDVNLHFQIPRSETGTRLRVVVRIPDTGEVGAANLTLSPK